MNEVKIITAFTPAESEPHILAEDDAAIYQGIVGEDAVMNDGRCLEAEIVTNNKVKIHDGVFEVGGHFARIPNGSYVEATITNGMAGQKRHDLIVAVLKRNAVTGDTATIEVKRGNPTNVTPSDPETIRENLYTGGKVREFPLYRVSLNGINIEEVTPMFQTAPPLAEIKTMINSNHEDLKKYLTEWQPKKVTIDRLEAFREGNLVHISIMGHVNRNDWYYGGIIPILSMSKLPREFYPNRTGGGYFYEDRIFAPAIWLNGEGKVQMPATLFLNINGYTNGSICIITPQKPSFSDGVQGVDGFTASIVYTIKGE